MKKVNLVCLSVFSLLTSSISSMDDSFYNPRLNTNLSKEEQLEKEKGKKESNEFRRQRQEFLETINPTSYNQKTGYQYFIQQKEIQNSVDAQLANSAAFVTLSLKRNNVTSNKSKNENRKNYYRA